MKNGRKNMTNFDFKVERMEEERARKQNERYNHALLKSLQTRTKEEVLLSLEQMLVIPIGVANVLGATQKERETVVEFA
jgi:hypothetical protein